MYVPSAFRIEDPALIREIVREHAFAALVTTIGEEPWATHLPILLEEENGRDVLVGHVAKANPQSKAFDRRALVIFEGPHAYITPNWYGHHPSAPTWNYVAVHAYGQPEIVEDWEASADYLRHLVRTFDPHLEETHPEDLAPDYLKTMHGGFVAFRMPVDRWDAKAKLSQNKPESDRLAVKAECERSPDPAIRAIAKYM